jgi:hypothetical protein
VRWSRLWRTRRPLTFNDKVRYKLLRDRRDLVVTFADKAAMREHVRALVGAEHLPELVVLLDDPAELATVDLPRTFVVKPTHGSGACVVVSDRAPEQARLPAAEAGWSYTYVRPEHADRAALAAIGAQWTRTLYGRGPNHEWAYGRVPRRILVEELLPGVDDDVPTDYKMFVFHGRCRFVQVDAGRFGTGHARLLRPVVAAAGPVRRPAAQPGAPAGAGPARHDAPTCRAARRRHGLRARRPLLPPRPGRRRGADERPRGR